MATASRKTTSRKTTSRKTAGYWLVIAFFLAPQWLYALTSDRKAPIQVQADHAFIDNQKGVVIYTGNVIITQGTTKITGDKVTLYRTQTNTLKQFVATSTPPKLTFFSQVAQSGQTPIHAWSTTIEYFAEKGMIYLKKNAKINKDGNQLTGDTIQYNIQTQRINAGEEKGQRIHMIIQPTTKSTP